MSWEGLTHRWKTTRNEQSRQSQPGLIIRDVGLRDLQFSVNEADEQLGVFCVTLWRVINGRSAITVEMALRLGKWVGNGPEIWLRMQGQYDRWQARKKGAPKVKKAKRTKQRPRPTVS